MNKLYDLPQEIEKADLVGLSKIIREIPLIQNVHATEKMKYINIARERMKKLNQIKNYGFAK